MKFNYGLGSLPVALWLSIFSRFKGLIKVKTPWGFELTVDTRSQGNQTRLSLRPPLTERSEVT